MRIKLRLKLFLKRTKETNKGSLLFAQNFIKLEKGRLRPSQILLLFSICLTIYLKASDIVISSIVPVRIFPVAPVYDYDYVEYDSSKELLRMNSDKW